MSTDNDSDDLFRTLMSDATPLKQDKQRPWRAACKPVPLEWPEALLHCEDDLSDGTPTGDEGPDTYLEYKGFGIQDRVMRQLKRGHIPFYDVLDLHGHTVGTAREALFGFIQTSREAGADCVLVIHGKGGRKSPPVLKRKSRVWLEEMQEVKAFCSALQEDGGTGAVYVLLKKAPSV